MSNLHFQNAEIITGANKAVKGQFVKFKVIEDGLGYKMYPSEKFCFLPEGHKKEFWDTYQLRNGIFEYKPEYIMELGLDEILANRQNIVAVEWPQKAKRFLPKGTIQIRFTHGKKPSERLITIWSKK